MWKPNESLDDYNVTPPEEVDTKAPRPVSLRGTGEVEVLKPLTRVVRAKRGRYAFGVRQQPLWFQRFLAVGSGALVMIAFVLVSAILVGIEDSTAGPEVATNETLDEVIAQPDEPFSSDVSSAEPTVDEVEVAPSVIDTRRRPARSAIRVASKPRRHFRSRLRPEEPDFVPTTLVIYADNGVINTRVEAWLQKPATFDN